MPIGEVDRSAVLRALAECDQLGEEAFLAKYGYGPAHDYFIIHEGKRYPSKAIFGVAHRFIGNRARPLHHEEFSGGEVPVARPLRALGFEVTAPGDRNPNWSRDEVILALAFYMACNGNPPDKKSAPILGLSDELNRLGRALHLTPGATFRNPNGVYMKLMNLRSLDPRFQAAGRVGLASASQTDRTVFEEYRDRPADLEAAAAAIRQTLDLFDAELVEEAEDDGEEAPEGALLTRVHRVRERSRKIIEKKKRAVLKAGRRLLCEGCDFDFEATYGPRGAGFIECHHTLPLSQSKPGRTTKVSDLALVCANCHRMIHVRSPWLSMQDLRQLIRAPQKVGA
jgi:5-methylcytosine-specific restriction enzyme A